MGSRPFGRTGVQVSKLCLGTMMFGERGTRDHKKSIRVGQVATVRFGVDAGAVVPAPVVHAA